MDEGIFIRVLVIPSLVLENDYTICFDGKSNPRVNIKVPFLLILVQYHIEIVYILRQVSASISGQAQVCNNSKIKAWTGERSQV